MTLEGDIDLRGFFAVDESVRPGYQKLRGTVRVVSSADEETLEKLQQAVNAHCPVLDIVSNPVARRADPGKGGERQRRGGGIGLGDRHSRAPGLSLMQPGCAPKPKGDSS